ncbi:hypothetical protein GW17_00031788 [Ensete ventricosum]|nr:hypothetical protein GW17_00031788 [Ensete ventricosum]
MSDMIRYRWYLWSDSLAVPGVVTQREPEAVLLSSDLHPIVATGAFIVPSSLYFLLKLNIVQKFVLKPYYLRREKQKALEKKEVSLNQVRISNSL